MTTTAGAARTIIAKPDCVAALTRILDRAITVTSSHDRQLNNAILFYVLTSRARENIGQHADNMDDLARSIGNHRGEVANAKEVFNKVEFGKEQEVQAERNADASKMMKLTELEKKFDLSL